MNQNKKDMVKDFFRKEGFYFVLFLCLCIVATVAAFTMKKNNAVKQQDKPEKEFTLNVEEKDDIQNTSNLEKQNADRVENNEGDLLANDETENEVANNEQVIVPEEQETQVSAGNTEVTLSLPLEGIISREFGAMIRVQESNQGTIDKTRRGIDVKTTAGSVVMAAAEGKVTEVSSSAEEGAYVVIAHANGLKTKYANLAPEVTVAVGDTVEAGTEIGTVGNSSMIFTSELCGDVLNLQVEDANGNQVDPTKYFNF